MRQDPEFQYRGNVQGDVRGFPQETRMKFASTSKLYRKFGGKDPAASSFAHFLRVELQIDLLSSTSRLIAAAGLRLSNAGSAQNRLKTGRSSFCIRPEDCSGNYRS
jgi:hypothetical protein